MEKELKKKIRSVIIIYYNVSRNDDRELFIE